MASVKSPITRSVAVPGGHSHPTGILTVFRPTSLILLKSAYVIQEAQWAVISTSPEV
jgi:hypothetical protein